MTENEEQCRRKSKREQGRIDRNEKKREGRRIKKRGQSVFVVSRFLTPQIFALRFLTSPLAIRGIFN